MRGVPPCIAVRRDAPWFVSGLWVGKSNSPNPKPIVVGAPTRWVWPTLGAGIRGHPIRWKPGAVGGGVNPDCSVGVEEVRKPFYDVRMATGRKRVIVLSFLG